MSQTCPYCRFTIPSGATVCGHCGAEKRTIVTEPYSSENEGGIFTAVIGLAIGAFIGWSNTKKFTGLLLGAVIGFIVGWWAPLVVKLTNALIGAGIGALIGLVITAIFSWGLLPLIVCGGIGGFLGYFHEKTEDRWYR